MKDVKPFWIHLPSRKNWAAREHVAGCTLSAQDFMTSVALSLYPALLPGGCELLEEKAVFSLQVEFDT